MKTYKGRTKMKNDHNQFAIIHRSEVSRTSLLFVRDGIRLASHLSVVWDEPSYKGHLINNPEDVKTVLPKMIQEMREIDVDSFIFSVGGKYIVSVGAISELIPPYGIYEATPSEINQVGLPGNLIGITAKHIGRGSYLFPDKFVVYSKTEYMKEFASNCGFEYYPLIQCVTGK